jgi:peptidoglycan/xylan/chitin deacetylase (PgdA/CDA1 family)
MSLQASIRSARSRAKRLAQKACSAAPFNRLITWHGRRDGDGIALTFDDGPHPDFTPKLLDLLRREGAVGSFFLLGNRVEKHPDLVVAIADAGHEIGIHGYDHRSVDLPRQTRQTAALLEPLGVRARLFRPPRGQWTPGLLASMRAMGYATVLWSLDSHDSRRANGHRLRDETMAMQGGDVLLFHDDNDLCLQQIPEVIGAARARGLNPKNVSTVLSL